MDYLNINVPEGVKIAVISDIHQHLEQFNKIIDKIQPSEKMWAISVGDIVAKGFGQDAENNIIHTLQALKQPACSCKGNNEIKKIAAARKNNQMTPELEWLDKLPLALSFKFHNGTRLVVLHGGILPRFTENDLRNNIEVAYVRNIDKNGEIVPYEPQKSIRGTSWHEFYDGRFGFVAAGHAASGDNPTYYNHSVNIDSCCYGTGTLSSQVFSENGLEELIQVKGKAFSPIQGIKKEAKKNKSYIPIPIKLKEKPVEVGGDGEVLNTCSDGLDTARRASYTDEQA